MTYSVELWGLIGSNPLAAMAAFGLLGAVSEEDPNARLHWTEADDWIAVLGSKFEQAELIRWLSDRVSSIPAAVPDWPSSDIRVPSATFRKALEEALDADPALATLLSCLGTDGAVDKSKGLVKPSAFYMVSGQQSFLDGLRAIVSEIRRDPTERCREALLGPWSYTANLHSLGWDPAGERLHALRHRAPTSEKPSCVPAAVWLAFEALPLFPVLARNGREETTGFRRLRGARARVWRWPLVAKPVGIETLRCLVQSAFDEEGAIRPGVVAVYESERSEFGQGYAVFRPAKRIR